MILIDFSHLSYRNLFTSVAKSKNNLRKVDKKYITDDFISLYFHQMILSLQKIKSQFKEYGDIILLFDDLQNWRKEILSKLNYKGSRKKVRNESEINFTEFYEKVEELKEFLKSVGYITVQEKYLEADDLGYILPKKLSDEKNLLVSEDKDWKQILLHYDNVDMYFPIKNLLIKNSEDLKEEIKLFRFVHILIGDKVDDINSVLYGIEFSEEFKKYLKEKNINEFCVANFEKNYDFQKYYDEFLNENENTENTENIEIFRKFRFGEKTAEKMIKENWKYKDIEKKFKTKNFKTLKRNFKRNRILVDFQKIPKRLVKKCLDNVVLEKSFDNKKILEFLKKYKLKEIEKNFIINEINLSVINIKNTLF